MKWLLAACPGCEGSGEVGCGVCLASGEGFHGPMSCTSCEGQGTKRCSACDGSGERDVSAHVVTALVCERCGDHFAAKHPEWNTAKRQRWLDEHAACGA